MTLSDYSKAINRFCDIEVYARNSQGINRLSCTDPEGGGGGGGGRQGVRTPLKNHKSIGFLSYSGPDHLKLTKLPSEHSMLGHHQHASETPFKWHFAGGLMMARL